MRFVEFKLCKTKLNVVTFFMSRTVYCSENDAKILMKHFIFLQKFAVILTTRIMQKMMVLKKLLMLF